MQRGSAAEFLANALGTEETEGGSGCRGLRVVRDHREARDILVTRVDQENEVLLV